MALGLVIFVACDDKGEEEDDSAPATEEKDYKFSLVGDNALLNNGKGKIELQLVKDDKKVMKLEASIDVTLTIVCGTDQTAEIEDEIGKDGKASIDVDLSNKDWGEVDWQACKLSVVAKVDGKDVKATDVELKTIGGEGAVVGCQGPNGCGDDDSNNDNNGTTTLPQFNLGEEIGGQSLGGKLSLHGCSNADIYTVAGDSVTRDADGVVEADSTTKAFPSMFVLGIAGSGCKLQHTAEGETEAKDWATVAEADAGNNTAAGHAVKVRAITSDLYKIRVTLPSANKPANAHVYLSNDGGATANKQDSINWDDTEVLTDVGVTDKTLHNARVLIKVSPAGSDTSTAGNDKVWWHAYGLSLGEFAAGEILSTAYTVATSTEATKLQVRIAEGGKCGLHFFHLEEVNDEGYGNPRRIYADKYVEINIAANADGFTVLPIDGGGASHTSGCKIGLNINGISHMSYEIAQSPSRPAHTVQSITEENGRVEVQLSKLAGVHQVVSYHVKASSDGGDSWKTHATNTGWSKDHGVQKIFNQTPYDVSWNSTASNNQALVWVKAALVPNSSNPAFWYYGEGN